MEYKRLDEIINFNPTEILKKGTICKKISMDKLDNFTKHINDFEYAAYTGGMKFRNGDTLLARITPCLENGKTSKVTILDKEEVGFGSTEYIVMRSKEGISNEDFIYYLAVSSQFRNIAIKSMNGTTGRQRVQLDVLKSTKMLLPNYEEQIKIGKILSNIDNKINLNNNINKNLYQMGKAYYNYYFKQYEFTTDFKNTELGQIPKEYEIKNIAEVTINNREKVKEDIGYKVLSAVKTGNLQLSEEYFNKDVPSAKLNKYIIVKKDDFAYNPARINIGSIGINEFEFKTCVSPVYVSFSINKKYKHFWNFYFKDEIFKNEVNARASGSVRQTLKYEDFGLIKIVYPNEKRIEEFNFLYEIIDKNIRLRKNENAILQNIRDTLLPKLMNGEIDLDKIEI